jgi:hypothetical protein
MNQIITIIIPAAVGGVPGVFNFYAKFKVFGCVATDGAYSAVPLNGNAIPIANPGQGFGSPTGPEYGGVTFTNTGIVQVTTEIYVGYEVLPQTYISNALTATATISTAPVTSGQFLKSVVAAGMPVAFGAGNFFTAKIVAQKTVRAPAKGGTANAGNVYIGAAAGANSQPITLLPGDELTIDAAGIYPRKFSDWYVDADNNGDGIVVIYG